MCGIVGYIGFRPAAPILIAGLRRLEYRGYDSAGIAVWDGQQINSFKAKGKISVLAGLLTAKNVNGNVGLAHTRWATHGQPNEVNAHPHFDCDGNIAVVHNGIIENFTVLKKILISEGHKFRSETDSEVLAHLIEKYKSQNDLETAVVLALRQVEGTYGLVVISKDDPKKIIAARKGSPLVIGVGEDEYFIASDPSAILAYTKQVIYLDDNEVAVIAADRHHVIDSVSSNGILKPVEEITWDIEKIEKGGFDTFMLKEIFEQPESITNALRGRMIIGDGEIKLGGIELIKDRLKNISRIIIVSCGTSWHSGLIGESLIEDLAGIPVEVEYASEFRYRNPIIDKHCLVVAISQSGETADTLAALNLAKQKGALTFGICNVVGSTIAREVEAGCYLHAGPEVGVASTKAFTSQLAVLTLLALYLGRLNKLSSARVQELTLELAKIPDLVKEVLNQNDKIKLLAQRFYQVKNFLYLGRGYNFPVALEGALKLKEISYIHAEGYPAAEMKHGPIALIDDQMPTVFIATKDKTYDKVISNILEVKARGGVVIAIATQGDNDISKMVDEVIYVPGTLDFLTPILNILPLQLLAYHIATLKGCDVDKPRNLAKSVTVE